MYIKYSILKKVICKTCWYHDNILPYHDDTSFTFELLIDEYMDEKNMYILIIIYGFCP